MRPYLPDVISVIMSTRDPLHLRTQRALRHLAASTAPHELILLSRHEQWTTGGYVAQGIAAASGEAILFLDDDCFVEPETLAVMSRTLLDNDSVGVVGALLTYEDRTVQHAGGMFRLMRERSGAVGGIYARHYHHHQPAIGPVRRDCDYVTGACMMTSRRVLDALGGYDPRCTMDWGDVDFCLRARLSGFRTVFEPDARAVHLESQTRGSARGETAWFIERWSQHWDQLQAWGMTSALSVREGVRV